MKDGIYTRPTLYQGKMTVGLAFVKNGLWFSALNSGFASPIPEDEQAEWIWQAALPVAIIKNEPLEVGYPVMAKTRTDNEECLFVRVPDTCGQSWTSWNSMLSWDRLVSPRKLTDYELQKQAIWRGYDA